MRTPLILMAMAGVACGAPASEGSDPRALMAPGLDCTACHGFTAAGTVFTGASDGAPAVVVVIGGAALTTNAAGNFFTSAQIAFPARPEVHSGGTLRRMSQPISTGACNACHGVGVTPRLIVVNPPDRGESAGPEEDSGGRALRVM